MASKEHETPNFGERRNMAKRCARCGKMVALRDSEYHSRTCKLPDDTRFMTPKSDQKPLAMPSEAPKDKPKTRNKTLDPIESLPSQRSESKNI